jgi:hypothetical protein
MEMLGGVKKGVISKLVKQGLLTNHNASPDGKRKMLYLDPKEVREVKRFYQPKGKDWKKALIAARAAGTANVAPPKTALAVRKPMSAPEKVTVPVGDGVLTRLGNIERKLDALGESVAALLKIWS